MYGKPYSSVGGECAIGDVHILLVCICTHLCENNFYHHKTHNDKFTNKNDMGKFKLWE